jgi:hypothetical protein
MAGFEPWIVNHSKAAMRMAPITIKVISQYEKVPLFLSLPISKNLAGSPGAQLQEDSWFGLLQSQVTVLVVEWVSSLVAKLTSLVEFTDPTGVEIVTFGFTISTFGGVTVTPSGVTETVGAEAPIDPELPENPGILDVTDEGSTEILPLFVSTVTA